MGGYASKLRRTRYFASPRLALKAHSHSLSPPAYLSSRALHACHLQRLALLFSDLGCERPSDNISDQRDKEIMPDHLHVITDSARSSADTLRFINGIMGHRIIAHLKERGYESSLQKLRQETKRKRYRHSLWDHHPNVRLLLTEKMLIERAHYLHENPVRAGLVARAEDYRYSSVRCWNGKPLEDEPLLVDIDRIKWRRSLRKF